MGRPLNKKYFGNRNIGSTSTTADNGIGGEGVATISVATAGSFTVSNTYKNFPLLNIAAPTIPGGVQATADVVFEINTVTFSSGGQTNADYVAGLSTAITGLGGGAIINITEVASKVTAVDVTTAGTNRGEFRRGDAFDGTGITTFQVLQAPNAGTDLQVNITFRVKSITIVEQGSGYVAVPNLSWSGHTFTGQTTPSGNTPALTTDSGPAGSSTNEENAIITYAYVTGGSLKLGDIVKQSNDKRYKVKTADGTQVCILKSTLATAAGEMNVVATDSDGGTYYVTKLTSRKAVLVPAAVTRLSSSAGSQFVSGSTAKWTFDSTAAPSGTDIGTVTIENA
jgi:hypothetical protein